MRRLSKLGVSLNILLANPHTDSLDSLSRHEKVSLACIPGCQALLPEGLLQGRGNPGEGTTGL